MLTFLLLLTALFCSSVFALAPLLKVQSEASIIPNKFIVVLKPGSSTTAHLSKAKALISTHNDILAKASSSSSPAITSQVHHSYSSVFQGYAGTFHPDMLDKLRAMADVAYIEPDQMARAGALQTDAPWNLERINSRARPSSPYTFNYDPNAGQGVDVYVLDTGIYTQHQDFEGRATWGANFVDSVNSDQNSHGSHCAGTVGSKTWGVAKKANLIAVKVLNAQGSGAWSGMISGLDWVVKRHKANVGRAGFKGSVVSMSIYGARSTAMNDAAAATVNAGVPIAVCGGNDNANSCDYSPASAEGTMTVGATDVNDNFASFSNWGTCTDILAGGVNVPSVSTTCATCWKTMSGTSMATPAIAGIFATLLSQSNVLLTPAQLIQKVKADSTKNAISGLSNGTPNQVAYINF
ncbi:cuticle-degrading serine protease [Ramicandelaber brevisporus]|nr:cuticle-degrading serine protease [Ramicandelaber brevisporus]